MNWTGLIIFLAILAVPFIWAISIYNSLVALRNRFRNGFAQIDVQLKRRYDLNPNLVETAKGYMAHERQTFVPRWIRRYRRFWRRCPMRIKEKPWQSD